MTSRRRFLRGSLGTTAGLVTTSGALAGPGIAAFRGSPGARFPLHTVIYEPARAQSARFAAAAGHLGVPAYGIAHDITAVWTRVVEQWRWAPVAIAGLTSHRPLLLLEQSARDHGLRVVFRAEHRRCGATRVDHTLDGPPEIIHTFVSTAVREPSFGACMAAAVAECPAEAAGRRTTSLQTRVDLDTEAQGPLYSWVLAPRRRAHPKGATA